MNISDGPASSPGGSDHIATFAQIPEWKADDLRDAYSCFASMAYGNQPGRQAAQGGFAACPRRLAHLTRLAASGENPPSPEMARVFFARHFYPVRFGDRARRGFVTAYFEPELPASRVPTRRFRHPLYARPADLVPVNDCARPAGLDRDLAFARRSEGGLLPYFDRAEIEAGALAGRGLEIAFLDNPVDAFLVHVQGSALLNMEDGRSLRITHDGKNGFPYTSVGKWLVDRGEIRAGSMSMATLRAWLETDSERAARVMHQNRSYIFFRVLGGEDCDGPVGSAGMPLRAGRSLAIDPSLLNYGTPIWIATEREIAGHGDRLARLMIAQDSGSAIKGPGRGDIFWGSGAAAGAVAGNVRHECSSSFVLMPRPSMSAR